MKKFAIAFNSKIGFSPNLSRREKFVDDAMLKGDTSISTINLEGVYIFSVVFAIAVIYRVMCTFPLKAISICTRLD